MTDHKDENERAADLVRRIGTGDHSAEREIILLYDRRLLVKLRQHTYDRHRISDLRQEVWIRVLEALRDGRVSEPKKFFGFLLGTARYVVLEDIKARKRQVVSLDDIAPLRDTGKAIELLLDQSHMAEKVRKAVQSLSDRDRQVIVRHYLREEPKEETCRLLGLTSMNYNNILYRARKRLAAILEKLNGEAEEPPVRAVR